MPAGKCDQCGVEEYMPYVCKFCKGRYCAAHRLPENHGCAGLGAYREKMRAEGRVLPPEPDVVKPSFSTTARAGMSMDALWSRVDQKMHVVFLVVIAVVFVLQLAVGLGGSAHNMLFTITGDWPSHPWTVVTSVFAHGSLNHLLFNGLALYFFGSAVERLIGTRRFTWLFLGAGAVGGVAQIAIATALEGSARPALGASGAIMGLMGTLVVLAPRLTVMVFFVIPAPLWALTIFYVALDLLGAITPNSPVANIAHLAGLATGLAFGYWLRQQGLRAVVHRPPPEMRRPF